MDLSVESIHSTVQAMEYGLDIQMYGNTNWNNHVLQGTQFYYDKNTRLKQVF